MKNITFWSSSQGKSGTSNNMLAVSTMTAVLYSLKTLLVQFDQTSNPIEQAFDGKRNTSILNEEFSYYNKKGLDELWEEAKRKEIGREEIINNSVNIKHTNLFYMPSSGKSSAEILENFKVDFLEKLIRGAEQFKSVNFYDCTNGNNEVSKLLLEKSDVNVINLHQGMEYLDELIENRKIREKALFIVGRYDDESMENISNIRRKYNIAKDCIGVIPYNVRFHDAVHNGKLVPFISKAIFAKKYDVDYPFVMELFHTTNMILRRVGYEEL